MDTSTQTQQASSAGHAARVPWAAVVVYTVLACGLAWLVMLPLWLGNGLSSPMAMPLIGAMMLTPSVAALIVTFTMVRPAKKARYLGFVPFRPVWRNIVLFLGWPIIFLILAFGAFFIAVLLGWTTPDWSSSSLQGALGGDMTVASYMAASFAWLPLTVLMSSVSAFGEELGWRGFLTSALAPLGFWKSAGIIGVIWGLWHAPIILLGYNFNRTDLTGLLWMCGFTLCVGVLLQWARYWTGNIWPAAVGHGALNSVTSLTFLWLPANFDAAFSTILGAPGWIAMGIVIVALVLLKQPRRQLELAGAPTATVPASDRAEN
ncbi:CPBP family intramembrane glutamic endopeptidase [Microbacterium sp. MPKO10]|uniref:CPBP family intramembrane glutamic endopeptidase n=1 Tax=Microbacterium sp. MPKO10 TaxID=2989818 RepID=UPI002235A74F|nr:type II CAAX endopeptidase family protein [Microbacterium sp. MPKO10]MCW4457863.1 CPBP family intramembrane metalloprotease [Microbacterium sp. MPKO10]